MDKLEQVKLGQLVPMDDFITSSKKNVIFFFLLLFSLSMYNIELRKLQAFPFSKGVTSNSGPLISCILVILIPQICSRIQQF